jgi:drug/metabolite transporter (DMT)-like permease
MSLRDLTEKEIAERKSAAGRFGFILGCIAAVLAFGIELFIAPKPISGVTALTAALMAALNVPFGIALGLLGERMTRRPIDDRRP